MKNKNRVLFIILAVAVVCMSTGQAKAADYGKNPVTQWFFSFFDPYYDQGLALGIDPSPLAWGIDPSPIAPVYKK